MKKYKQKIKDCLFTAIILGVCYILNLLGQFQFQTHTLVPMLFVLGVFFISYQTEGYFWGILASLISVIVVNYTFTIPYYALDFITAQYVLSAIIMLVVAIMTSTITKKFSIKSN